ncbi:putative AddB-like helicase and PD-(D/E)XK nuclease superfamily domain-containing protein [Candidatus Hepatincolaceae symbiont of Richtersius coronifer]
MNKVYNISFNQSFLDILSKKLLEDTKYKAELLADYLLLLPNKKAIQNLQGCFLKHSQAQALILPRMIALSDLDYILSDPKTFNSQLDLTGHIKTNELNLQDIFKATISPKKRAFILSKLIQAKDPKIGTTQAVDMAESLGKILDRAYLENVNFDEIDNIVDSNLSIHWQEILKFLHIATLSWPGVLKEFNSIDLAYKKKIIYQLQSHLWKINPPQHPIIAVNISSYYEDILTLLATIRDCPKGALVFYGVDYKINHTLPHYHPQKALQHTLHKLKIAKEDMINLEPKSIKSSLKSDPPLTREALIHRMFDHNIYKDLKPKQVKAATNNISIIVTKNEEEEAKTVALALREVLEYKEKTAGLISNSKNLITRVINELKRWNILIDDYLGTPLLESNQAKLFMLVGKILENNFEAHLVISLLKNPFCRFGKSPNYIEDQRINLDLYILRNPILNPTLATLVEMVKNLKISPDGSDHRKLLALKQLLASSRKKILNKIQQQKELLNFLAIIKFTFKDLEKAMSQPLKLYNFKDLLIKHIKAAEMIAGGIEVSSIKKTANKRKGLKSKENNKEENDLWSYQEGKELSLCLGTLLEDCQNIGKVSVSEYLGILQSYLANQTVRQVYNRHPRLHIYGTFQSSLIHHDLMIISNLNEQIIPYIATSNPWINNYIMHQLGFLPKEHNIGLQAEVFCQILGAPEVILSRAEKEKGSLTTPSRWLLKLQTLLKYYKISELNTKNYLLQIQEHLDSYIIETANSENKTLLQNLGQNLNQNDSLANIPAFNVPDSYQPTKIPTTSIEQLFQNPYVFFINRILKLKPLEGINPPFTKALYGSKMHLVLEDFFKDFVQNRQLQFQDQQFKILDLAKHHFGALIITPTFAVFAWNIAQNALFNFIEDSWPRFNNIISTFTEKEGFITLNLQNNLKIKISGKADRIDLLNDNSINIIDYKTSAKVTIEHYKKQLPLLSLIFYEQGFKDIILENLKDINAQYVFFPNKIKDNITTKTLKDIYKITDTSAYLNIFKQDLIAELEKYYIYNNPYKFTNHKNIREEYLHFARFTEWNNTIELNFEEETEQ